MGVALGLSVWPLAADDDGHLALAHVAGHALLVPGDGEAARAERSQDGCALGLAVASEALVLDGPPSALHAQVVGPRSHQQHAAALLEGQGAAIIPQQHQRPPRGLARERTVLLAAHTWEVGPSREGIAEEAQAGLHTEYASNSVVHPAHGDEALVDGRPHAGEETAVALVPPGDDAGQHDHINPRVDGLDKGVNVLAPRRKLVDRGPVRDQDPVKSHLLLQDPGEQPLVTVHLLSVHRAEGCHDRLAPSLQAGDVGPHVRPAQLLLREPAVAAVQRVPAALARAEGRGPVPDPVLRAGQGVVFLQAHHGCGAHGAHEREVVAEALVCTAPTDVLRHRYCWGKDPVHPCGSRLHGGGLRATAHELRVAAAAEAYVVRKEHGPHDVALAVH
mmetsp:Transcript_15120/g.44135  ORF Transcript_15120/g.44135 Transcript_15120/m.44135 type:complete len:390 (+) Transcript_15120:345-1514(+)